MKVATTGIGWLDKVEVTKNLSSMYKKTLNTHCSNKVYNNSERVNNSLMSLYIRKVNLLS